MRLRRRLNVLIAVGSLALVLLMPGSVAASPYTGDLAGRPYGGSAATSCHGIAYGRAGGSLVLFTAKHCRGTAGTDVIGPSGTPIGFWPAITAADSYDLSYIVLYTGNWPSAKNIVYSGSGSFTITRNPPAAIGCNNLGIAGGIPWGTNVYQAFQTSTNSTNGTNNGTITGFATHNGDQCIVNTTVSYHPGWKDSGSPFILSGYTNTVFGLATTQLNGKLQVNSLYGGINALNTYWVGVNGTGAWLCQTASC
jgi:hypothetical protein